MDDLRSFSFQGRYVRLACKGLGLSAATSELNIVSLSLQAKQLHLHTLLAWECMQFWRIPRHNPNHPPLVWFCYGPGAADEVQFQL